jgi:hypothetical protein
VVPRTPTSSGIPFHVPPGHLLPDRLAAAKARDAYQQALELVHGDAERRLLERRLAEL